MDLKSCLCILGLLLLVFFSGCLVSDTEAEFEVFDSTPESEIDVLDDSELSEEVGRMWINETDRVEIGEMY